MELIKMKYAKVSIVGLLCLGIMVVSLLSSQSALARRVREGSSIIEIRPGSILPRQPGPSEKIVIIFDLDGTLINENINELSKQLVVEVLDDLMMRVEGKHLTTEEITEIRDIYQINQKKNTQVEKTLAYIRFLADKASKKEYRVEYERIMDNPNEIATLERTYGDKLVKRWREFVVKEVHPQPGALSLLERIQEANEGQIIMALLSNNPRATIKEETEILGFSQYFDEDKIIGVGGHSSVELPSNKEEAIGQLKQELGNGIYIVIGDTVTDIQAANATGAIPICYGEEFLDGASARISNYSDPDKIVEFLLGRYP
ncbi:MAG: HAD hydrolase-like protein [Candidatus Omnitrophica bacterium]|nr:HAD hydrolase-like protein [Candidatus Omnitrophota bacterium]